MVKTHKRGRFGLCLMLLLAIMSAALIPLNAQQTTPDRDPQNTPCINVLIFSKTAGYRHTSIDEGIAALNAIASDYNWDVFATEDSSYFTSQNLAAYDVVVFLMTTGNILNESQQTAFEGYIQAGGGWAGVHSASDTEYTWPWYGGLVGAYFSNHPSIQTADVIVENDAHPATTGLPDPWTRNDEWYNFQSNPRSKSNVDVLLRLDESSYSGGDMGADHPIAWTRLYDGGRAFYTGMGHTEASYSEPLFRDHLRGGIEWAANANCGQSAPEAPTNLNTSSLNTEPPIRPLYQWSHPNSANDGVLGSWYQVMVRKDDAPFFSKWYPATQICNGTTCSVQHPTSPLLRNGNYEWWVQAYVNGQFVWSAESDVFAVSLTQLPSGISVDANEGRPTISWAAADYSDWFQLYIGGQGRVYSKWLKALDVCGASVCSYDPPINFPGGSYQVWMQAWGAGGYSSPFGTPGARAWRRGPDLNLPTEAPPIPSSLSVDNPAFGWQAVSRATWYQIVIAPQNLQWSYSVGWYDAAVIDCPAPGNTCTVSDPDLFALLSPNVDYFAYVRAWGPGGMSEYAQVSFTP